MLRVNKFMRILSVFLAVLIVSVGFMTPVAYANAAVAEKLIWLVASLMIGSGMVFTSSEQARSTATYAISTMPPDMHDYLLAYSIGIGMVGVKGYEAVERGITDVIEIGNDKFEEFKAWACETFGINAETVASGYIDTMLASDTVGNSINLPVYSANSLDGLPNNAWTSIKDNSFVPWFDFTYNGYSYTGVWGDVMSEDPKYADAYAFKIYENDKVYYSAGSINKTYGLRFKIINYNGRLAMVRHTAQGTNIDKVVYNWPYYIGGNSVPDNIGISSDAYANTIPINRETVEIGIPDSLQKLINLPWNEIIGNFDGTNRYGEVAADWNYNGALDRMQEQLDGVCADLGHFAEYDALLNQSQALQLEIDRLHELVAAQGSDVIGGVGALNDAMVDAGLVLNKLRDLVAAQEASGVNTAALEAELARVKELIKELTNAKEIDVPVNPPVVDEKSKINWKPLLAIKGFTGVFPFCIPFDIIGMFSSLQATPKAPLFKIPFEIPGKFKEEIVVDLSILDPIMPFVRAFILLVFGVSLARFSSSVIKW